MKTAPYVLFFAALSIPHGPVAAADPAAVAASAPTSARLLAPVAALIGEAECDTQEQCHTVGVGAKACGGPSAYLAWSEKKTDPKALQRAVEAQARSQVDENKAGGLLSDCRVTPMPPAVCRPRGDGHKVCQLGQGGANSPI